MKRALITLIGLITLYVIYIDLTTGTLPIETTTKTESSVEATAKPDTTLPAFTSEVKPGQTLISIVESHIDDSLPVSIEKLIEDFETLNPGQAPEKIQIGKTYQFPDYSK
nr:hypothetical protein [Neobacillus sp. Marseille-Q6967]